MLSVFRKPSSWLLQLSLANLLPTFILIFKAFYANLICVQSAMSVIALVHAAYDAKLTGLFFFSAVKLSGQDTAWRSSSCIRE